jgi:L-alanine-DL-glutamate epimerase-like enolase superfamily enzyme
MKIVDVTLTPIAWPAPHPLRWGRGERNEMGGTILQVHTDEGIVGLGDATAPYRLVKPVLEDTIKPLLLGQNPLDVERLWARMARGVRGGAAADLVGGIDVALWDIVGKAANMPLFRIFGAYRNTVPCYVAPCMRQPDALMEELARHRERGFKATKLRIGLGVVGWADGYRDQSKDIAIIERARDVLGPNVAIGADTDKTYDHAMTARLAPVVHEVGLEWLEEPISSGEREQYVREMLRAREIIHVALSGGQGFFAPEQFDDLIGRNAVDIVQPDVNHVGGLTPLRKVAAMAGGHGLSCMPHVSCHLGSDIITMATAHVLGAMPNGQWLCYQAYDTPLRTDLLTEPVKVIDGAVRLSDKPGLGIELDQAALKRFAAPV